MTATAPAPVRILGRRRAGWLLAGALAAVLPADARAQVLDAAGLEALAGQGTLHFRGPDGAYGAEQFLSGRRSLWRCQFVFGVFRRRVVFFVVQIRHTN